MYGSLRLCTRVYIWSNSTLLWSLWLSAGLRAKYAVNNCRCTTTCCSGCSLMLPHHAAQSKLPCCSQQLQVGHIHMELPQIMVPRANRSTVASQIACTIYAAVHINWVTPQTAHTGLTAHTWHDTLGTVALFLLHQANTPLRLTNSTRVVHTSL